MCRIFDRLGLVPASTLRSRGGGERERRPPVQLRAQPWTIVEALYVIGLLHRYVRTLGFHGGHDRPGVLVSQTICIGFVTLGSGSRAWKGQASLRSHILLRN